MEDDPQIKILNRTFSNGATLRNTECLHNKKPVTKSRATLGIPPLAGHLN